MLVIRLFLIVFISMCALPASSESSSNVHDFVYDGLVGIDIKSAYLGKDFVLDGDLLDNDFIVVEKAVITDTFSPVNTRKKKEWVTTINDRAIEVEYFAVGRFSAAKNEFIAANSVVVQQIKKDWLTSKFSGVEIHEPQYVACSIFIDHVAAVLKFYEEEEVYNYEDNNPKKIKFIKLNEMLKLLPHENQSSFCSNGFSLIMQKSK